MTAWLAPFAQSWLASFAPFGPASFGLALFGPAPFGFATFGRAPLGSASFAPFLPIPPSCQRITMLLTDIPFGITAWDTIEATEHAGESGTARWRTRHFGAVRVRMVEYSAGYRADHWCDKGHILLCLAGELETDLADGRQFRLVPGMTYQVADHAEAHRSRTQTGATLFIVD